MEETKYYQPEIEEFHVGFEYEMKDAHENWAKYVQDYPNNIGFLFSFTVYPKPDIRVKCLDQEDIESFGFDKKSWSDSRGYWKVCKIINSNTEGDTTRYCVLHFRNPESGHITLELKTLVGTEWKTGVMFSGKIKNRSELKRLLKQLEII